MIKDFTTHSGNWFKMGLLILLVTFCFDSFAQEETNYFILQDVISLAQKQSPDAQIAKHRFRSSYWEYRSFKAGYLPSLVLNAELPNFTHGIKAVTQSSGADIYKEQQRSYYSANLNLTQKVGLTGANVFLQSGLSRLDDYTDSLTHQYLLTPISIGFNQPIFGYNAYKWDNKIKPMRYEEALRTYLETNEQVAITAGNHFFNLLLAQVEKSIAIKNQSNYDTLYNIAKGRYMLGKIAENELLQLELNLLSANAAVENADLEYQNMLFTFKSFMRIKSDQPIILVPPAETEYFTINMDEAIQNAKTNTSSGINFERQILEAESQLNQARLEGRFDATINATFGLTRQSDILGDFYTTRMDDEQVSLGITIPILDWGQARGRIKMAESNLDLVKTSIEQARIDFEQNIFLKVMHFNMQKNQMRIAAKADTVAQKRFDVTQKRYMIGKVNDVLELNNAQIDNDNAKKGYYNSLKTYWTSFYDIRKSTLFDFAEKKKLDFNPEELID
ncbi:MAG: TolC family protein [Bacteroidales bacterium]|nr:TolC family protein [Bacteroidales bacterium]